MLVNGKNLNALRVGLNCRVKANCPHAGPVHSVEVFLRDTSIYESFGEKNGKFRTVRSTSATGN